MSRVLVVEDEPQILATLTISIRASGFEVAGATSGAQALSLAGRWPPDLVVLDLGLPDRDGLEVIKGLRAWTDAPIIVLSGRTGSSDKVRALDAGADDYVTKPFGTEELLARLRATSRRTGGSGSVARIRIGEHVIDLAARTVGSPSGTDAVRLTPTEWDLLERLARRPGRLVSREELSRRVWGAGSGVAGDSLRVYLARLRRKLEPDPTRPRFLVTEPGMGYRFQP
jgi:two-component system KDP operon response regulator KdpE